MIQLGSRRVKTRHNSKNQTRVTQIASLTSLPGSPTTKFQLLCPAATEGEETLFSAGVTVQRILCPFFAQRTLPPLYSTIETKYRLAPQTRSFPSHAPSPPPNPRHFSKDEFGGKHGINECQRRKFRSSGGGLRVSVENRFIYRDAQRAGDDAGMIREGRRIWEKGDSIDDVRKEGRRSRNTPDLWTNST